MAGTVCYDIILRESFWGGRSYGALGCYFADILLSGKSPLLFALIFAKIVKKSKNINDAERIVCYNKGGQKGAG